MYVMPSMQALCCGDEDCTKKVKLLECSIEDLKQQNCNLIAAVGELENEAYNRVHVMEELLQRTAQATKSYMVKFSSYEQVVRGAMNDKIQLLSDVKKLQELCIHLEKQKGRHQSHANNLTHDVSSLIKLVTHARNTGQWNVGNIDFCEVTFEQVFGSIDHLSHWSAEGIGGLDNSLCDSASEVHSRDETILNRPSSLNDAQAFQMQVELRQIQQILGSTQAQLSDRDRMIAELQTQITDLNNELSLKETNCFVHQQIMEKVQNNGRRASIPIDEILNDDGLHSPQSCDLTGFPKSVIVSKNRKSSESVSGISCDMCKEELQGLVLELQDDNRKLIKKYDLKQAKLESCNDELESVLKNNLKLEQELSVVENLWQELETYKEDKEKLLINLCQKYHKIKELEAQVLQQMLTPNPCLNKMLCISNSSLQTTECGAQTDVDTLEIELVRLRELEQRHQRKATGLEVVIQQLQVQMSEKDNKSNEHEAQIRQLSEMGDYQKGEIRDLRTKLENLQKYSGQNESDMEQDSKVSMLTEQICSLNSELDSTRKMLVTKEVEVENQKQTISNLQDALANVKRSSSVKNISTANGQADLHARSSLTSFSTQRTNSKSSDIFDI